jgi:TolB-like protein
MRKLVAVFYFLLMTTVLSATDIVLSVADFTVETGQAGFQHIGKGISRIIAGELRKTKGLSLLEREQIVKITEEQELSLSGLADESRQIEIGRLLSAEYLILGALIDMKSAFLVSVRMVSVTTGQVVWQADISEKLEKYDYIGAYFAKAISTHLELRTDQSTTVKLEDPKSKSETVVLELSEGIAAFDEGNREEAKQRFSKAKAMDPESEVAAYYLDRLVTNSAKFMVITPPFYSYQNPAFLGILRTDRLHLNISQGLDSIVAMITGAEGSDFIPVNEVTSIREYDMNVSAGYYFPLGRSLGMGLELFQSVYRNDILTNDHSGDFFDGRFGQGGMLSFGIEITEEFSLGFSVALFNLSNFHLLFSPYKGGEKLSDSAFSAIAGFLVRNKEETIIFDMRGGYTSAAFTSLDPDTLESTGDVRIPVLIENTLTLGLNEKRTFLVVKNLNELTLDTGAYYFRILPAAEHFFSEASSLRAGLEGAMLVQGETGAMSTGFGILGGFTWRFLKQGIDIDLNLTYRKQPSRMIENLLYPQTLVSLNVTFNDLLFRRNE